VNGSPALGVIGDLEEGKEKKVVQAVFAPGETNTAVFALVAPAKSFDTCQPQFEALVDSYTGQ